MDPAPGYGSRALRSHRRHACQSSQGRTKATPRYRCAWHERGGSCDAQRKSISAATADEVLAMAVGGLTLGPDWHDVVLAETVTGDELRARIAQQRAGLQAKLDWQRKLLQDGDIDQAAYRAKRAEIEAALAQLAPPQEVADVEQVAAMLRDLRALWTEVTDELRKQFASQAIEAVYYDLDRPGDAYIQISKALQPLWSALPRTCTTRGSDGRRLRGWYIHSFADLARVQASA